MAVTTSFHSLPVPWGHFKPWLGNGFRVGVKLSLKRSVRNPPVPVEPQPQSPARRITIGSVVRPSNAICDGYHCF